MSIGVYDYYFEDSVSYRSQNSSKYFGLSIVIHASLFIGALFVAVPHLEKLNPEPIIIELSETETPLEIEKIKPIKLVEPKGEKIKPTRGGRAHFAPMASALLHAQDSDIISGPTKTSIKSKSNISKIKTQTSGGKNTLAQYAPSRAGVPETLEDIPAPKLDFESVEAEQIGQLGDDAFENEFKNIDKANEAAIRAEKMQMDNQAKIIADESDASLKSIENKIAENSRVMQNSIQATRSKNAAALAQLRADEKAAADKAAREQALTSAQSSQSGNSKTHGLGQGNSGANERGLRASGRPDGIRDVTQLKQVPGNPIPQYSVTERLRREQGRVIFQAYVTPDGRLTNFKLTKSTGYKNLDGKTLAALKKWKFYPGQQGWVEIPQNWNIKGQVEEMPVLLRRQVSQR